VGIILLSLVASVATLVFTYVQHRKKKAVIMELLANNYFQEYNYAKKMLLFFVSFAVLGVIMAILSFTENKETDIAISIILLFVVFGEPLIVYPDLRFYYNDTSCILEDKLIRYKSIKEIRPRPLYPAFLKQMEVVTINNDKIRTRKDITEIIETKMKEQAESKPKNETKKKAKKNKKSSSEKTPD
jgi:hypothetical protein